MIIWILDDDSLQTEHIKDVILNNQEYSNSSIVCLCNEKELIEKLKRERPDVLISDIELGQKENNGISLVKKLFSDNSRTQVIYLTGFSEYCSDVYETKHTWFLLKPLDSNKLFRALDVAKMNLLKCEKGKLVLQSCGKILSIYQKDIIYIESEKRKMRFCTFDGQIEAYMTNEELLKHLNKCFAQCHRSFFVNMDHVKSLKQSEFLMINGITIPISQLKRKSTKDIYLEYISSANKNM